MIRSKVYSYATDYAKMSSMDRFLFQLVEKIKFLVFSMFVQDLILFSVNELARHDITIRQEGSGLSSYLVVLFTFSFVLWDIC